MTPEERAELARKFFREGANCSQAVLGAFAEDGNMPLDMALACASGLGGGMARMREVCGAVSGMFMADGLLRGRRDLADKKAKDEDYIRCRRMADRFKSEVGSIICRELLGGIEGADQSPISRERTVEYYRKRPCVELVALAARILAEDLELEARK